MVEHQHPKTPEEREAIVAALKGVLEAQPDVRFAYLYGSFLEGLPFHDVDVAIYLEDGGDFTERALELAGEAERAPRGDRAFTAGGHPGAERRSSGLPVFRLPGPTPAEPGRGVAGPRGILDVDPLPGMRPLVRTALKEAITSWA
ncbi:MAG: nucleotidyltransferase domain-containing protein [Anaerolineae bacterium]|nr:nucleotidyltransferase domain-containing protein [Anaerolineae bacterium]MDW8067892.1 nucleotidyltransferase domain-containing protein [Anaerolineae bacterium]